MLHTYLLSWQKAANADDASKKENEAKGSTSLTDFLEPEAQAEETERISDSSNENRSIATSTTEATAIVPINSVEALLLELSAPVASSSSDQSTLQMPSPETAQNSTLQMSPPLEPEQNSTNASEVETAAAPETSTLALTVIKSDKILEKEEENAAGIQTNQHQFPFSSSSTTLQSASSVESSLNEVRKGFDSHDFHHFEKTTIIVVVIFLICSKGIDHHLHRMI